MNPNPTSLINFVNNYWDKKCIPGLSDFIRIPCKSVAYDLNWKETKYLEQAAQLMADWAMAQNVSGLLAEVVQLSDCAPSVYIDIPGQIEETVLIYGHLDKMPESEGWNEGLGPWEAVLCEDKLYGRGGCDDGYPPYMVIAAIKALQEQKIPHPRCVIFMESGEESGSPHFQAYLDHFKERIGNPKLIVLADADADRERLINTISLRGLVQATLSIEILKSGVHSGSASGIVPSTFRILRQLLDRIEDQETGHILLNSANVKIPSIYVEKAKEAAAAYGARIYTDLSLHCQPVSNDVVEMILNSTWRPTLCVTGADGLPAVKDAGNVLRAFTKIALSLRLPPSADPKEVGAELKTKLEENPPYGARIKVEIDPNTLQGWSASEEAAEYFDSIIKEVSNLYYEKGFLSLGCGGGLGSAVPLIKAFPKAQMWICGTILPDSGTHGPNEFLHIPSAKKLTCCFAEVITRFFK